jgi:hypothetical protein
MSMLKNRRNLVAADRSSSPAFRVSRVSIVAIAASLVMATSAFASTLYPSGVQDSATPGKHGKPKGGIVGADGSIVAGTGYSVSHDNTGQYTLDVPAGYFKDCPVVLATPAGYTSEFPIINDYDYITCGDLGEVKIQIRVWGRKTGAAQDNAFHFLMSEP